MRYGTKSFKEFHELNEWKDYIGTYMANTKEYHSDKDVKIITGQGETIAVWQRSGYGYVEECRSPERLTQIRILKNCRL